MVGVTSIPTFLRTKHDGLHPTEASPTVLGLSAFTAPLPASPSMRSGLLHWQVSGLFALEDPPGLAVSASGGHGPLLF